jgi:hypothetical protein
MWWRLFWWIITTALTDILTKRPPDATPAGIGDFAVPTATEGRVVPIALGNKMKINAPNCIWYGDYVAVPIKQSQGVIIKSDVVVGYTYELSLAYALLKNEIAGITGVWIGDERVYDGVATDVIDIDRPKIFGGRKSGGGFVGRIRLFPGTNSQAVSTFMSNVSRVGAVTPAYRGTSYVMVTDLDETKGAEIGEQPNLRHITFEVQLADTVANGGLGDVLGLGNDHHIIGDDGNPASIAYALFTDDSWGRGLPVSDIDAPTFTAAAETAFTEGIGFSMLIDEFTTTESIQDLLEQHMDCYIGPNAQTGKFEIKLARPDYTLASEFQVTDDNIIDIPSWNKGDWTQTFNRVRLRYMDRDKDWNETHSVANAPANRIIQGRLVSQEVRYPGVHNRVVANKIAAREKKNLSRPIKSGTVEVNRSAWNLRPGDIFGFTSSQVEETDVACRITKAEIGDPIRNTMRFEVVEDIFDSETATVADPPDTDFIPPPITPVDITDVGQFVAPRWIFDRNAIEYGPRVFFVAGYDAPNSGWKIQYQTRALFGSGTYQTAIEEGPGPFVSIGTLFAAVPQLTDSANDGLATTGNGAEFEIQLGSDIDDLIATYPAISEVKGIFVINPGALNEEWVAAKSVVDSTNGVELTDVIRGVGDTAILEHDAGELVCFVDDSYLSPSAGATAGGGLLTKFASKAQGGEQSFGAITAEPELEVEDRLFRPLPPRAMRFTSISTLNYFGAGALNAIIGLEMDILNRRFEQLNPVRGADGKDDAGSVYSTTAFADYDPQINIYFYDITANGEPTALRNANGDAVWVTAVTQNTAAGILDSHDEEIEISAADIQNNLTPGNLHRLEFTYENQNTVDDVLLGTESRSLWVDRVLNFPPAPLSLAAIDDTLLLIHGGDGEAGSSQVIDYSKNNWPLTLSAGVTLVDDGDLDGKGIRIPAGDYIEIADDDLFHLDASEGFTVECRIKFISSPPAVGQGINPFVSQWRSSDSQKSWWVGMSNDDYFVKLSSNGSTEANESEDEDTLGVGVWYAFSFSFATNLPTSLGYGPQGVFYARGGANNRGDASAVTSLHNSTAPIRIGADLDGNEIDCIIDELRIMRTGMRAGLGTYTLETENFWGRERIKVLHCNWENAVDSATTYNTDDLNRAIVAFPANEVTQIDDAQSKFGNNSLFCGGVNATGFDNSDGVAIDGTGDLDPLRAVYEINQRDFTMECFVRLNATPAAHTGGALSLITKYDRGLFPFLNWYFYISKTSQIAFSYRTEANVSTSLTSTAQTINTATWYHVAVVRKAGVLSLYFEGNRVAQDLTGFDGLDMLNWGDGDIGLGRLYRNSSADHWVLNGWLDEVRMQIGVAEYDGATYTVPTAAFPVDPVPALAPPTAPQSSWSPNAF